MERFVSAPTQPGCHLFFNKCSNTTNKWGEERIKKHVDKSWYKDYDEYNTKAKCEARRVAFSKSCSGTGSNIRMKFIPVGGHNPTRGQI